MFRTLIFLLSLALISPAFAVIIDRLETSVNSDIILLSDVHHFRRTLGLRSQLDPLFNGTPLSAKGARARDREIVEFLTEEKIIANQFPVQDSEVEQEINSIQVKNGIDRNGLKTALKGQGFAFDDYFQLIRTSISKRNLIDRDIRTKVHISEDDIKNFFYNQYRGELGSLSYRIKIITISRSSYTSERAVNTTAKKALSAIRGGESFEEIAKRYSDAPSAPNGGDLGLLSASAMSPVIRKQIKKIKVGEVSSVFGSPKSTLMILKLEDIKSGQESRLAKLSGEIRSQLTAKEYQRQIKLWIQREKQRAYIHRASRK